MSYGYSIIGIDPDKTAIASGRNMPVSPKQCREVCKEIRGKNLDKAIELLEAVIEEKVLSRLVDPVGYRHPVSDSLAWTLL